MSLLLEARKKSRHAPTGAEVSASSAGNDTAQDAREAGQNLFSAKSASAGYAHINPYLLYALGGTLLLLAAGAGYWWYLDSSVAAPQYRVPPAAMQPIQVAAVAEEPQPASGTPIEDEIAPEPAIEEAAPVIEPPRQQPQVRIEPVRTGSVDPLLRDAYLGYRNGKLEEAQRLYQEMTRKDANNADALLGLAAIAQQRGDNLAAAQYYLRVLTLDPRNAVANAGMSALNAGNDGNESRLKMLLREQNNSAALHFALGNLYAGQSRWGEAQQAYFSAWTLEPDNAEFAYNLAVSLDHLGQSELAMGYYQRAQQLDATHSAGFDHDQVARRIEALGQQGR